MKVTYLVTFYQDSEIRTEITVIEFDNRNAAINKARTQRPELSDWGIADVKIIGWENK